MKEEKGKRLLGQGILCDLELVPVTFVPLLWNIFVVE
jgi:hypothetical protein